MNFIYIIECIFIFLLIQDNFAFGQLTFSYMFGMEGSDVGQFKKPVGIAVDGSGKIYVAEFGNHRIQVLNSSGDFISFIPAGIKPHGIEIYDEKIYVVSWGDKRGIEVFNKNGTSLHFFQGPDLPADVTIDKFGKIYVTDFSLGTVQIFDSFGNFISSFVIPETHDNKIAQPTGITLDTLENIYVADYGNNRVMKFDSSGNFLSNLVVPDEKGGGFIRPTNIEIDQNGHIFVTDNSDRVLVFDSFANFIYSFGETGQGAGQFSGPHGITFDDFGNIYIAEYSNNRIQVFNTIDSVQKKLNNDLTSINSTVKLEPTNYLYLLIASIVVGGIIWIVIKKNHKNI